MLIIRGNRLFIILLSPLFIGIRIQFVIIAKFFFKKKKKFLSFC